MFFLFSNSNFFLYFLRDLVNLCYRQWFQRYVHNQSIHRVNINSINKKTNNTRLLKAIRRHWEFVKWLKGNDRTVFFVHSLWIVCATVTANDINKHKRKKETPTTKKTTKKNTKRHRRNLTSNGLPKKYHQSGVFVHTGQTTTYFWVFWRCRCKWIFFIIHFFSCSLVLFILHFIAVCSAWMFNVHINVKHICNEREIILCPLSELRMRGYYHLFLICFKCRLFACYLRVLNVNQTIKKRHILRTERINQKRRG